MRDLRQQYNERERKKQFQVAKTLPYTQLNAIITSGYGFVHFFNKYLLEPSMCHGEGNGNPLQYSCLENPMDGEAR